MAPPTEVVINRQLNRQPDYSPQETTAPAPTAAEQVPAQQANDQSASVDDSGNLPPPEAVSDATASETSPTSEVKP